MLSPYEKAIKALQEKYADNPSLSIKMSKGELMDLLFKSVSSVPAQVYTARKVLISKEMIVWPSKLDSCVLSLDKIKAEGF